MSIVADAVCQTVYHLSLFFNDTAATEIYTLSLHDALPICLGLRRDRPRGRRPGRRLQHHSRLRGRGRGAARGASRRRGGQLHRSEEHTSELQSRQYLVCRLLLEKKKAIFETVLCCLFWYKI